MLTDGRLIANDYNDSQWWLLIGLGGQWRWFMINNAQHDESLVFFAFALSNNKSTGQKHNKSITAQQSNNNIREHTKQTKNETKMNWVCPYLS